LEGWSCELPERAVIFEKTVICGCADAPRVDGKDGHSSMAKGFAGFAGAAEQADEDVGARDGCFGACLATGILDTPASAVDLTLLPASCDGELHATLMIPSLTQFMVGSSTTPPA
jgi:hypothetical protein